MNIKFKGKNKLDNDVTIDQMVAEARAEYFAGELKGFANTEELIEDLHKYFD